MREDRIVVRPFEDLQVLDYQSIQQVNEHARASLKGMIPYERQEAYMEAGRKLLWVQVMAVSEEKEEILFYGVAEHMRIQVEIGICMVNLSLCSGTLLMDLEEHIRSFQNDEFTYKELLDVCSQEYENAAKIIMTGKDRHIPHFIMQYRETDWMFVKRLAAMNHTVVFADCSTKGEKYHFGIPDRKAGNMEAEVKDYATHYNIEEYWKKKKNGLKIRQEDTVSYIFESREPHKLGEIRIVDNRSVFIWKIETSLKGNELYHNCFLKPRAGFQEPVRHNPYLAGTSLAGIVKNVAHEKVQITINSDEYKHKDNVCWFSFSSVYSSEDGSGWYCMPEVGDIVRLYFPTAREQEAYVASAYHEEGANLRTRPERKFWRNKEGKEIQLSPESIILTNNDGTYIELSDKRGIKLCSEGSISIWAGDSLRVSAGSMIELSATGDVVLKQGNTRMNLNGDITMQGARVKL